MLALELLTFPSSAYIIIPIYLGGLVSKKRRFYIVSLVIFFISTDLNMLLKEFFQMPLDQRLNLTHTYAFPSGHIQNTAVLWGSLALCYKSYTGYAIFVICLAINGLAVYLLGFHTILDILGAYYVAAIILLFCFQILPILWYQIKSRVCTDR
jgi:membrane-associated phospholipid phosphatase